VRLAGMEWLAELRKFPGAPSGDRDDSCRPNCWSGGCAIFAELGRGIVITYEMLGKTEIVFLLYCT
jgi:hypothetical protein